MTLLLAAFIALGAHVSWLDRTTGERYCGTLTLVDMRGYAWILPDRQAQNYAIEPYANVTEGCS